MAKLVLIRGVPGSGKTTKAKNEYPNHTLVEADMFFDRGGVYKFDGKRLKDAHEWCQNTTKNLLDDGFDVVVANTFTRIWEMEPYLNMGYEVFVDCADGNYQNVHGVPIEAVNRMRERFEEYTND